MTSDTWTNRDLPVLRAIVELYEEEEDEGGIQPWEIRRRTGFDEEKVRKALRALNRQPYFEDAQVIGSGEIWIVGPPTAEALRVVGQWPSTAVPADQVWVYAVVTHQRMPKSRVSQTTVFGAQRPMLRTLHDKACAGWMVEPSEVTDIGPVLDAARSGDDRNRGSRATPHGCRPSGGAAGR